MFSLPTFKKRDLWDLSDEALTYSPPGPWPLRLSQCILSEMVFPTSLFPHTGVAVYTVKNMFVCLGFLVFCFFFECLKPMVLVASQMSFPCSYFVKLFPLVHSSTSANCKNKMVCIVSTLLQVMVPSYPSPFTGSESTRRREGPGLPVSSTAGWGLGGRPPPEGSGSYSLLTGCCHSRMWTWCCWM